MPLADSTDTKLLYKTKDDEDNNFDPQEDYTALYDAYLESIKDARRLQGTQQVASQSRLSGVQVRAGSQMQARTDNTPKNALAQDETDS